MSTLLLLAPFFLVFELWQLVLSERYLGVKQIARGANPRTLGLSEITAFFWSMILFFYWLWMLLLLAVTYGRMAGLALLAISMIGFSLRRGGGLKWALVILTFEGAFRVAVLVALCTSIWRRL